MVATQRHKGEDFEPLLQHDKQGGEFLEHHVAALRQKRGTLQ